LGSGELTVVSETNKELAVSDSTVCTPVGTNDTDNHSLAQLAEPHTGSPGWDPDLGRVISAWSTLGVPIKHAILAIIEATR
jgi:hypothetical protein